MLHGYRDIGASLNCRIGLLDSEVGVVMSVTSGRLAMTDRAASPACLLAIACIPRVVLPRFQMISFILSMLIGGKLIIILWITTEIRSYHEYDNEMEQGDWLI